MNVRRAILGTAITMAMATFTAMSIMPAQAAPVASAHASRPAAAASSLEYLGTFVLKNIKYSGYCLQGTYAAPGLELAQCNYDLTEQQWEVYTADGVTAEIVNAHTGGCLDDSKAYNIRLYSCNGENYQRWNYAETLFGGGEGPLNNNNTGRCMYASYTGVIGKYVPAMGSCNSYATDTRFRWNAIGL